MADAVEAGAQRVPDHLRRPISGSRNILMNTAGNTVNAIAPIRTVVQGRWPAGAIKARAKPPLRSLS